MFFAVALLPLERLWKGIEVRIKKTDQMVSWRDSDKVFVVTPCRLIYLNLSEKKCKIAFQSELL